MRVPRGAPVPFWLRMRNKFPALSGVARPTFGTVAVIATVLITGAAVSAVTLYPKYHHDYYQKAQAEERALLRTSKDELAHGQRVWSDPFERKRT